MISPDVFSIKDRDWGLEIPMPLRDTLNRLREQQREGQAAIDRPALIAEWKSAVDALLMEIRNYLAEYVEDGSLSINPRRVRLTEDSLGTYEIGALDIEAGPALILVRPVGLIVAGAEGRVDMHRMGRAAEQHRIMLLRMRLSGPASRPAWFINFPPEARGRMAIRLPLAQARIEVTPLTKGALEDAVEFLLQ
jgi:hypothetical protein